MDGINIIYIKDTDILSKSVDVINGNFESIRKAMTNTSSDGNTGILNRMKELSEQYEKAKRELDAKCSYYDERIQKMDDIIMELKDRLSKV